MRFRFRFRVLPSSFLFQHRPVFPVFPYFCYSLIPFVYYSRFFAGFVYSLFSFFVCIDSGCLTFRIFLYTDFCPIFLIIVCFIPNSMIFYKVENKGIFFLAAAALSPLAFWMSALYHNSLLFLIFWRRRAHACTEPRTHTAALFPAFPVPVPVPVPFPAIPALFCPVFAPFALSRRVSVAFDTRGRK